MDWTTLESRPGSFSKNFGWGAAPGLTLLHRVINAIFNGQMDPVLRDTARATISRAATGDPLIPLNFFLYNQEIDGDNYIIPDQLVLEALANPHDQSFDRLAMSALNFSRVGTWRGARPWQAYPAPWARRFAVEEVWDGSACDRWDPDPQTSELLEIPIEIQENTHKTREFSETARCVGLPLAFAVGRAPGNPYNWPFEENDPSMENRLPENEKVAAVLEEWEDKSERILTGYGDHWVGGHPLFVQYDVRGAHPKYQHLDRVLFHLGCDDQINLGDAGLLNVMISNQALARCDFQEAYLTWDCS